MRHLFLALALVGCSDGERPRDPAQAAGARALERAPDPEPLPETAAAVSPAELAPGQPHDLGDGLLLQVERAGSGPPAHAGSRVTLRYVAKVKDTETVVASTEGWQAPLARLARRHEVLALRLYDPLEMALPDAGLMTVQDAETGEQLFVDTSDPGLRARYAALAEEAESTLRAALAGAGVDTLELATDDDLMSSLLRFVALRRQRLKLPASHRMPPAIAPAPAA